MAIATESKILTDLNIRHDCGVPLGPLTWYGVGGPASLLAYPSSVQQLSALAAKCHEMELPVYVLGSGANLLVADQGVRGVVVQLDDPCFKQVKTDGCTLTVGAGFDLAKLVLQSAKAGLKGLECLAGIPASVGGAVRMNAGGLFGEIGQSIRRVMVCDVSGQIYYRDNDDLIFGYRKTNIAARYILDVEFELSQDNPDALMRQVKEIFLFKRNSQPLADRSAGCAFKNPENVPSGVVPSDSTSTDSKQRVSAGQLIDQAGLKGLRVGGAVVSPQHANFIVTHAGCTANDILAVLERVQETVLERFGVLLEREVVVWS